MDIHQIKSMSDLYEYVQEDNIPWVSPSKKLILRHEAARIKNTRHTGRFVQAKEMLLAVYPFRYLLARHRYQTIVTFRSKDLRQQIRQAAITDILQNSSQYEQAYALLDETSRKTFLHMLLYRLTGDYTLSIDVQSPNEQYFSNQISWGKGQTIVDCGAYIGDTLSAFLRHEIDIANYYLYELDDANYTKMSEICEAARQKGIDTYPKKMGVYSHATTLYFQSAADSSTLVDYPTENAIPVVSIDEDIHDNVSFIKMDIEGSELEAINGAVGIIQRDKPLLAICIYHKQEDFWKIPLRIKEICPDYKKFWIEQYSPWDIETVLYAQA